MKEEKKILMTPKFRVSFPHVYKKEVFEGEEKKYACTCLFDADEDLSVLKKAAFAAAVEKFGKKEKWPKSFKWPFKKGDDQSQIAGYEGKIYLKITSNDKPGIVDQKRRPITEESGKFYAGCYARATVSVSAFDKGGGKGVAFYMQNIQKLEDGEPFSSKQKAEDAFDEVEGGEETGGEDFEGEDLGF